MFGLLSTNGESRGPTYENDPVDLQVKSLLYIYKRLRVNKLASFSQGDELQYYEGINVVSTDIFHQKLDVTYNIERFKQILLHDEHRILVDFQKNKFRAFCLIEEHPSANISRPNSPTKGGHQVSKELNGFPVLLDEKNHSSRFFKFELLPLKGTPELVCEVLAASDIYAEHRVDWDTRMALAIGAMKAVLGAQVNFEAPKVYSHAQRAAVIRHFLTSVATHVQITRIYEDLVNRDSKPVPQKPHISASPGGSPTKSLESSPNRVLKASRSVADIRGVVSPPKLSSRKSVADLRHSNTSSTNRLSSRNETGPRLKVAQPHVPQQVKLPTQLELWEKSSQAVKARLARERQLLMKKNL